MVERGRACVIHLAWGGPDGALAELPRINCWALAERAGHQTPHALQHLLGRARWDADAVRDDLRAYVVGHLGDTDAVLVVDETGDVKKSTTTVGVQRQYVGAAGRVENRRVAVYLVCAAPAGYAFLDRALYLPKSWTDDPARLAAAGVPQDTTFATKPALASVLIGRALDAGVPAAWVTPRAKLNRAACRAMLSTAASRRISLR